MKTSLEELQKNGWEGIDVSLDISLYEYGLIWKFEEDESNYHFIYGIEYGDGEFIKFGHGWIDQYINPMAEWNWIEWDNVCASSGYSTKEEFLNQKLPLIISDLVNHYGYMEIFGEEYHPFEIPIDPPPPTVQEIDEMRINGNISDMINAIKEYGYKFWFEYSTYIRNTYQPGMGFDILSSVIILYHQKDGDD